MGKAGSQNHQGGANRVSQFDGRLRYGTCLLALWGNWERAQERNSDLCQHFCLAIPLTLILKPDNSAPPIWPWHLLSYRPSAAAQGQWIWINWCTGPLWGTPLSPAPSIYSAIIPIGFHIQKLWGFFFSAETLAGDSGVRLGSLPAQVGPLKPIYLPWFLTSTRGCTTHCFCVSVSTKLNVISLYHYL